MTDTAREERSRHDAAMARLRSLAQQGIDVSEEMQAERRRHGSVIKAIWRKAHPDRARAAIQRDRAAHPEERKRRDLQYRKSHPEKQALAMRRWNARRKILREFMAIDESIFQ